jgi:ATP-binding cassette, subfamily B, bacterial HlyB/CyaB
MKTQEEQSRVEFLASLDLLSTLTAVEIERVAQGAQSQLLAFGDTLCAAGSAADGLFIVKSGSIRVFATDGEKERSLGVLKAGEIFAEFAALGDYRHEWSARSSGKTEVLFIPRDVIGPILDANTTARAFVAGRAAINAASVLIRQLFDLKSTVSKSELEELTRNVGVKRAAAGQEILKQGTREDHRLYVVRQGAARIVCHDSGQDYALAELRTGEIFGEKACLLRLEQPASVIAIEETVLLVMPEKTVQWILERNPKVREVLEERMQAIDRELQRQKKVAERRVPGLLIDLGSKAELGQNVIRRFGWIQQAEEMDCGAACLAMVCKHYGVGMTLGKLRELANVTKQGASLDSLARTAESIGFTTKGVKCSFDVLRGFQLPFIVHWEGYHYVVVYGVSSSQVWVADPAVGFKKMSVAEFERGWGGTCLTFTPRQDFAYVGAPSSPWMRFARYLLPYRKILLHLFMATFVIQMLGLVPPLIIQNILDSVIVHQNVSLLHLLILGLVISNGFTLLTGTIRNMLTNFMVRKLDFTMMSQFLRHTLSLPYSFFAKRQTGDIFARFQENQTIRAFLTESTITTVLNVLMIFIYITVLFLYNATLTLLLMAFVIPLLALTVAVTPRVKRYAREVFGTSTEATSYLMEALSGAETVKGMGIERPVRMKWETKYAKALGVQYNAQSFNIWVGLIGQSLNAATTIAVLWVGANLVLTRQLTIGQLVAFNALMGSVLTPMIGLIGLWSRLNDASVAMERLGDVLDVEPEQKPEELAARVIIPELRGEMRLDGVYFRYGGDDSPYVLENISIDIKPGELVAIVGRSGSGKTTLAKLLVGFYPPTEGRLTVDGYEIGVVDKEYFRAQVGYVMQTNLLFSGTIADNIATGSDEPDRRRIEEVAKKADAHGFISKLPLGYQQVVGERGVGLSGGQIQRLCIARALYRDPRLLVFDEATSALDSQSESNIVANLNDIMEGRTSVVIAHRLSTIMRADKILVMYEGKIVEQGRHEELVDRRGMYYELVQKQLNVG